MAGYLTVLKNNFAGTQAAEMGEDPPLTYFCRSRGTCDVTSAVRRPVEAALGGGQSNCPEDYVRPYSSYGKGRRTAAKLFLRF